MLHLGHTLQKTTDTDTPTKQLDVSDATSMTTASSSAVPSPCSDNAGFSSAASSANSSPSPSLVRAAHQGDANEIPSSYSMISVITPSPEQGHTSADHFAEDAWSDSDNGLEDSDIDASQTCSKQIQDETLVKRSDAWRQAHFPECVGNETADNFQDRRNSDSEAVRRTFRGSENDSARGYSRSSWAFPSMTHKPFRTRRSRATHSISPSNDDQRQVEQSFSTPAFPEYSYCNSTGKCYSSPNPRHGGPHVTPLRAVQDSNLPNSQSKSKKKQHKKGLEMAGLLLEDRFSLHSKAASSLGTSFPMDLLSRRSWTSMWLCRIRLTTLMWGLIMIGITIVGKSAIFRSESASPLLATTHKTSAPLPPATGGLRGSLLLSTVSSNRKPSQPSRDSRADPEKQSSTEKKKKAKATTPKKNAKTEFLTVKHPKTKMPARAPGDHAKRRSIAYPKPMGVQRTFEDLDAHMYASSSLDEPSTIPRRMVVLNNDILESSASYSVQQYPAALTDNTQFYGVFDSSDERLRKMELREPYEDGECVPMKEWQTTFHPSCNGVHELGVEYLGGLSTETNVQLFGTKGYWRYAWRLDLQRNGYRSQDTKEGGDTVVLKTLKFQHNFEDAHFEHDRIDAVAMERLTSSPHVINVFGFCGHSVLTEFANGPRLGELADKSRHKPLARLKIARDIANGLADVHGIDAPDGTNATFIHLDINPANVISIGGTLKLNDFNIGIIRRWNTTSQKPCGFPAQYPNPQWRSPEEARGETTLTERVDVFSMGHIFFRLICGHEPWNKLEPGGKPSKEIINEKVKRGFLPTIPDSVMNTSDPEVAAIRDVMLECYRVDPRDRPSAREITRKLEAVLETLSGLN